MSDLLKAINVLSVEGAALFGAAGAQSRLRPSQDYATKPISVIIPSRNEGGRVVRTVRSLIDHRSWEFPLEVVVVDDASGDGSCDGLPDLATESPNVSVIVRRLDQWSGIPYARNRGAEVARHPIFLITDANTAYPENWDDPIRRHLHCDRILAGTVVDEDTGQRGYGLSLELPSMGVTWISDPARFGGYVPAAACTCTVLSRSLFQALGGYDETMPLYGAAEPEFSVRAWLSGYEIVSIPELQVFHHFRPAGSRNDFQTANRNVLLQNYVRFACSYLPQEVLEHSLRKFAELRGDDFDACMGELEAEGIWNRREHLRHLLRHDFSWYARRFCPHGWAQDHSASHETLASAEAWTPAAGANDLTRTLVVIPTFKDHNLTRAVIKDFLREWVRIVVVDNSGDYQPICNEKVLRPNGNLGWLRSNNFAIQSEFGARDWDRVVLLNNDVQLSQNFFAGIVWAERKTRASIVAASYDDWWSAQRLEELADRQTLEAHLYSPRPFNIRTGACDGTAVSIRRDALEKIGLFDEEHFGKFGWSGMTDLCYRARAAGLGIVATRAAYVHHIGGGHQTAKQVIGDRYAELAGEEGHTGMVEKWGPHWGDLRNIPNQEEVNARYSPKIAVYTAIFGDYDHLKPREFDDVDHICFTDQRHLSVKGWRIRQVQGLPSPMSADDRVRLARRFKALPHTILPEYQIWLWQDANLELNYHPGKLVAEYLQNADLATFQHQKRNCIYDEARVCAELRKDDAEKIFPQVSRYQAEGYPRNYGLIWSALIIRRNTAEIRALNEAWWSEMTAGSRRDQLSFNYVAWRLGQGYAKLPLEIVTSSPHKQHYPPGPRRSVDRRELTILLLNWKRPQNLPHIIASIERQSKRPNIFLWNNGTRFEDPRVDWIVDSSRNKRCWPRWTIGAMADTDFVCSLDDDLALGDDRILEDLLHYLKSLDEPDRLVGASGVILQPAKSYEHCHHVKPESDNDIAVDIVKGKLLACRRDALRSIEMVSETREDDIAISGLAARGRRRHHRIPPLFTTDWSLSRNLIWGCHSSTRMMRLEKQFGVSISHIEMVPEIAI
jgi:GT2 family glycosyltransferase